MMPRPIALALTSILVVALTPETSVQAARGGQPSYSSVVSKVANMVDSWRAKRLVQRRGLRLLNVLWEDTGRYYGSSVGPNISDVTIEVKHGGRTALMPVLRFPNFRDKTADVSLDKLFIRVGNQNKYGVLQSVPLAEVLRHPARYMSFPQRGRIRGGSLLAKRDTHALVSAQAAFLPIPKQGKATFWPVIFNYQSSHKNPAVLTLLVTRQGTSMTIIDNTRDVVGDSGGQRLYFNKGGRKAPLSAERLSTVMQRGETANGESAQQLGADANLLMLIQVPLRLRPMRRARASMKMAPSMAGGAQPTKRSRDGADRSRRSDVEQAVLGHGPVQGPFKELDWLSIRRDTRFPIRVTIQFYQATSNGVVDGNDVQRLARQINRIYEKGDYVGSLVLPDGKRPTMWTGASAEPGQLTLKDFPGLAARVRRTGAHGYFGYFLRRAVRPRSAKGAKLATALRPSKAAQQ